MADLNRRELLGLLAWLPFVGRWLRPLPSSIDARWNTDCPMIPGDPGWNDVVSRKADPIAAARSINGFR